MSEIDADEILEGAEGEGESKVAVNKLTWAQVGLVTEPGRYMFKFGWLTITADDLAIWQKYPRRTVVVCLVVLGSAALLEMMQLLTPDRHGPFGCDREDGRRCCRHRGWSSNPLFRASQPLVPELIRSADIKLNERISLPRAVTIVSLSQLRGVPSHATTTARSGVAAPRGDGGPAHPPANPLSFARE
jgi:hypothetical protein